MVNQEDARERQVQRKGTTPYLYFVIFWTVLSTFNFGFGTSELNPLQNVLSCPAADDAFLPSSLPTCIALTSAQFGYITALFTIGGFISSLSLSFLKSRLLVLRRSRNVLILAAVWNILGGLVQMMAATWPSLGLGRLLTGLGSGLAVAVVPSYLNDISPAHLRGSIGVLNQLSIVVGILTAQAMGVSPLGQAPSRSSNVDGAYFNGALWRFVPLISAAFALLQILLAPFTLDSPSDLHGEAKDKVQRRLWGATGTDLHERTREDESEALLEHDEPDADTGSESTASLHTTSDIRMGTMMIIFTQMAQQLSGVNAVLYFSTGILSDVFKGSDGGQGGQGSDTIAKQISLGITLVNVLMTFPPIPLIRESLLGRKKLLQLSSFTMSTSALVLSFALLTSRSILAAISIVFFVAGFSTGLGPIPFLILPELVPKKALPAAASLGLSLNWLSNITVASLFLPLKNTLASVDGSNGGSIFLVFVVINAISFTGVTRYYTHKS
ncbi:hypothetical protein CBS101457_003248 [Exobasidium rhododendri]|nr:hypothetical protein CBS101457_003248 [Exobasidium rhododendri]